jgi:RNA polymerase sigma factor (sigma-70 family)
MIPPDRGPEVDQTVVGNHRMNATSFPDLVPELGLISTEWSLVFDPVHFVNRYEKAIKRYLRALLKNSDDTEDVAQDFFLWVTANGFPRVRRERGRFRDYLKVTVKNWALNFLRRKRSLLNQSSQLTLPLQQESLQGRGQDQEWLLDWRSCLLNRAWRALELHQDRSSEDIYYTALQLAVSRPTEDSGTLAALAGTILGRSIRPDTFRKQLSRARRLFAELLVKEVAETLDYAIPDLVEDELVELGLMSYVAQLLPDDWHSQLNFATEK